MYLFKTVGASVQIKGVDQNERDISYPLFSQSASLNLNNKAPNFSVTPLFFQVLRNQWLTQLLKEGNQLSTTLKKHLSLLLVSRSGLLDLLHNALDLLTKLEGVGSDQICQLIDLALQGSAQLLGCGLQLSPDALSLGLQLLAQTLCLGLQNGRDVAQLLGGGVSGLVNHGLNIFPHGVNVLGGAGLDLTKVGGHSAGERKKTDIQILQRDRQ